MKRRGFTLIEMMVVVLVLVTLMTIVFKLGNIGTDASKRAETVSRMQRLENCLSGYYAAYGSYPPVKLHGSRDIGYRVGRNGIQTSDRQSIVWSDEATAWNQIRAACKAQPVDIRCPASKNYSELIMAYSETMAKLASQNPDKVKSTIGEFKFNQIISGFDDGGSGKNNTGRFSDIWDKTDWRECQIFQFGLLSFLVPRYFVMLGGADGFYNDTNPCAQWEHSNTKPRDPFDGRQLTWLEIKRWLQNGDPRELAHIANIPSQAVCARWLPNLEGICSFEDNLTIFGIRLAAADPESADLDLSNNVSADSIRSGSGGTWTYLIRENGFELYSPAGSDSDTDLYWLPGLSIKDGWRNDFYYYSPEPHQSYTLWSGGANGKTFPPWISREDLPSDAKPIVAKWTADDIAHLSN